MDKATMDRLAEEGRAKYAAAREYAHQHLIEYEIGVTLIGEGGKPLDADCPDDTEVRCVRAKVEVKGLLPIDRFFAFDPEQFLRVFTAGWDVTKDDEE